MLITYRRTGGLFALLTLAAVAVAATVLTVVVAAIVLAVASAIASAIVLGRAVLPRSWRNRTVAPKTPWPHDTIDAEVVNTTSPSNNLAARTVTFERMPRSSQARDSAN